MTSPLGTLPGSVYKRAVLIDTGPLYAVVDTNDGRNDEATACLREISDHRIPLYITNLTIAECHRLILQKLGIDRGLEFLEMIYDGRVNIVRKEPSDDQKAIELLQRYPDQDITFTDAISFAVMIRLGIIKAFSFDRHFDILNFLRIPPLEILHS